MVTLVSKYNSNKFLQPVFLLLLALLSLDCFGAASATKKGRLSTDSSYSFFIWGHPRGANPDDPILNLDEVADKVKQYAVDFVVITGDMIEGRVLQPQNSDTERLLNQDWDKFDNDIKKLGVPVYRVPGNHDVNNILSSKIYTSRYGALPFSFAFKNSKLIMLDSNGINERLDDTSPYWGHSGQSVDEQQILFLKNELKHQSEYEHIFIFMHHTARWSEPGSPWWNDVHPLLIGTNVRAVFTGDNPYDMKFSHEKHNDIHYIENNTFQVPTHEHAIMFPLDPLLQYKQFDNLGYVKVEGDKFYYDVLALGALSSKAHSWSYWRELDSRLPASIKAANLFHQKFHNFRSLVLLGASISAICFILGLITMYFFKRRNNN